VAERIRLPDQIAAARLGRPAAAARSQRAVTSWRSTPFSRRASL
jgi:hypothetical protein